MKLWQSGRESQLLDDIIAGRKTIEGRLNKGKFAEYSVGDIVSLRRDYRNSDGVLVDGEPDAAQVKIIAIRRYDSFLQMAEAEGYESVIPTAASAQEAADVYNKYYSVSDQKTYGVLAIEIKYISKLPLFITGNQSKADYLSRQLGIHLEHKKIDLDEIQSTDLHKIVEHKLQQAYAACNQPVLVEDVSLVFNALGDLPGPYIKWFVEGSGAEACCRMLDGFDDRSAIIKCTFGYYDGERMEFFDSELDGTIADHPAGQNGFGFDTFFINKGYDITRAEMTQEENEHTYATMMKPFAKVRAFIKNLE